MGRKNVAQPAPKTEKALRTLDFIFKAIFSYVRPGPKSKMAAEIFSSTAC